MNELMYSRQSADTETDREIKKGRTALDKTPEDIRRLISIRKESVSEKQNS